MEYELNPEKYQNVSSEVLESNANKSDDFHIGFNRFDIDKKSFAIGCLNCKELIPFQPCSFCGNTRYRPGYSPDGELGLFCMDCKAGLTQLECINCHTSIPISCKTVFEEKGGCFIATAVYDSYGSYEVVLLREFRDKVLYKSFVGRIFIKLYYHISPPIAKFIRTKKLLKRYTREIILEPVVYIVRRIKL